MYKLIDFGNVFSIAFGINIVFVLFELSPKMDDFFIKKIVKLGEKEFSQYLSRMEYRFILTRDRVRIAIGFAHWKRNLIKLSAFNSILSILILIFSGFFPEYDLNAFVIILLILVLFAPIIFIPYIIFTILPYIRMKQYKYRIDEFISKKIDLSENEKKDLENKYSAILYLIALNNSTMYFKKYYKDFDQQLICDLMNNNIQNGSE